MECRSGVFIVNFEHIFTNSYLPINEKKFLQKALLFFDQKILDNSLTHFMSLVSFCNPCKYKITKDFLVFQGRYRKRQIAPRYTSLASRRSYQKFGEWCYVAFWFGANTKNCKSKSSIMFQIDSRKSFPTTSGNYYFRFISVSKAVSDLNQLFVIWTFPNFRENLQISLLTLSRFKQIN